ncbi:MAG: light-independent protochlorophyllide reductase subunit B [Methanosaeta sp. PtaU1.Bin055]|nr:MAG: light-independent protochlorophyllide reductase subunit B [Methanosaeta sp. PtaU1.Bin055]
MSTIYDPLFDCKMVGALRAMHGINDCISIIHGRNGCHCGALLLQTLGSEQNSVRVLTSGLKASDEVYSGEERLSSAIRLADQVFEPKAIAVLNCSAPVIMGEDVEGLELLLEGETRSELVAMDVGGPEGPAWIGYEEALTKLVSRMRLNEDVPRGGINLLGFKADDLCSRGDLNEMNRILRDQGLPLNSVLCGSSFEEVKKVPQAELNVLLGGDGLDCAKAMEEEFDLPYISVPYPYGLKKSVQFVEMIGGALGREADPQILEMERERVKRTVERAHMFFQGIYSMPVAVVGESGRAFDLAEFLSSELGMDVKLLAISSSNFATPEKMTAKEAHYQKLMIEPDRWDMNRALEASGAALIFGSSFEKRIASELQASLVRFSYPVIDEISLSDLPFAGFSGIAHLCEKIINSILTRNKDEVKA